MSTPAPGPSSSSAMESAEGSEIQGAQPSKRAQKRARQKKKKAAQKAAAAALAAAGPQPAVLPPATQSPAEASAAITKRSATKRASATPTVSAASSATAPSSGLDAGASGSSSALTTSTAKKRKVSASGLSRAQSPPPASPPGVALEPSIPADAASGTGVPEGLPARPAQLALVPKAKKKLSKRTAKSRESILLLNSGSLGPVPSRDPLSRAQHLVGITSPHSEAVSAIRAKDAKHLKEEVFLYNTFVKESAAGRLTLTVVLELLRTSWKKLQRLENSSCFDEDSPTYEDACLKIGASLYLPLIEMLSSERVYSLMIPGLLPDSKSVLGLPALPQDDSVDLISHQKALELCMEKAVSVCLSDDPRFSPSQLRIGGLSSKVMKKAYSLLLPEDPDHAPTSREISGFETSGGYSYARLKSFVTWAFGLFVEYRPVKSSSQPVVNLPPIKSIEFFVAGSEAPPLFSSDLTDKITGTVTREALDGEEVQDYLMLFTGRGVIASGEDLHCGWEFSLLLTRTSLGDVNITEANFLPSDITGLKILPFKKVYKCDQCDQSLRLKKCYTFGAGTCALIYCAGCVSSGIPPNEHSANLITCASSLPNGMSRAFKEALTEVVSGIRIDVIFWGDGSRIPLMIPASYYGPRAAEIPRHNRLLNLTSSRFYFHGTAMAHAGGLEHFLTYAHATVADQ